jgi:hypothetical protein
LSPAELRTARIHTAVPQFQTKTDLILANLGQTVDHWTLEDFDYAPILVVHHQTNENIKNLIISSHGVPCGCSAALF